MRFDASPFRIDLLLGATDFERRSIFDLQLLLDALIIPDYWSYIRYSLDILVKHLTLFNLVLILRQSILYNRLVALVLHRLSLVVNLLSLLDSIVHTEPLRLEGCPFIVRACIYTQAFEHGW